MLSGKTEGRDDGIQQFVVYAPPEVGLPYLVVTIEPDGAVTAVAFGTEVEAEEHITAAIAEARKASE